MTNLIGHSLGRYHILEPLGEGGMAMVYKAYDTRLESDVAVKVIRTENLAPTILERALKRFEREAKALAKLTHSNIVKVLDYGEYEGEPYLVMPYLPGGTLKQKLNGQPMPWNEAARLLIPIARALSYAHEQGMIHRDVKPSNILITHSGDPMLTDFGIAKIIDEEATMDLTGTSAAVGTPEYMAPEQVVSKSVDHRADIYALGIVYYEMVTGRRPFTADTPMAVLFKHASEPLPRPSHINPAIPVFVEQILIKALAKKPEDRYQTMSEMGLALEKALGNLSQKAPAKEPPQKAPPVKPPPTPVPPDEKTVVADAPKGKPTPLPKWLVGGGVLAVVVVGVIAAAVFTSDLLKSTPTEAATVIPTGQTIQNTPVQADTDIPVPPANPSPTVTLRRAATNATSNAPTTLTVATDSIYVETTLDPALAYDAVSAQIIQNVYETLVFYDGEKTNAFLPQLAESWEVSSDGKTWTFYIRKGVKFHNGDELTPGDVAYSFQRGLLQGGGSSPQWLLAYPFLGPGTDDISFLIDIGGNLYDNRDQLKAADADTLRDACGKVTSAIVADDAAGTVTMTLSQPWAPFLVTISQSWGSILDKNWVIQNGGWDGSCDTWQNYYAMQSAENPLSAIENGTGPFTLESLTPEDQYVLIANQDYWRGAPALERVVVKAVPEWDTRFAMMQSGDADIVTVPSENLAQMDALVGEECIFDLAADAFSPCEIVNDSNPIVRISHNFPTIEYIALPNFSISTTDGNRFIGSGQLDGKGIPPDFFSDLHIRKAFAYCFNWDEFIQEVYPGGAIQSYQILSPGMLGFDLNMPHYSFDPAQCEQEFKLADVDKDGIPADTDSDDIWQVGFRFQAVYSQGNTMRQSLVENFAKNVSSVNNNFVIEIVGLPSADYLPALRGRQLPIVPAGIVEDIHDSNNVLPYYLTGIYAQRQSLPDSLQEQFKTLLDQAVSEMDSTKRAELYRQISQLYYEQAVGIPLVLTTTNIYMQRWIQGEIINPAYAGYYFYPMYKR